VLPKTGNILHIFHPPIQSSPVVIETPATGDVVGRYTTVTGKIGPYTHGWPVVLVQPILAGEPWYVQPEVLKINCNGSFSTPVYIGNATTPPGTGFRIVVILVQSQAQALQLYPEGMTLTSLPTGLPTSPIVQVTDGTP